MKSQNVRILIVDDDEDIRINIADILNDLGYETVTAEDAESAMVQVRGKDLENKCGFDLCLLDFKMPGVDGAELFERIRGDCPNLRAIMITAYAGDDGVRRALDAGTWKVMRKPVDIESLIGLINEAMC